MADPIQLDSTAVTGTRYVRCSQITITNPLDGTPMAQCQQDTVTVWSDGSQHSAPDRTLTLLYDPAASLPIVDPTTGQQVSSMPMPQVFAILFSVYAAARAAAG